MPDFLSICVWLALTLARSTGFIVVCKSIRSQNSLRKLAGETKDDDIINVEDLNEGLRLFRDYAKRGIKRFMENDLVGAVKDFDRAKAFNSTQPLLQRGMILYLTGNYHDAAEQFYSDIILLEKAKIYKMSDIRLWLSASYNKCGQMDEAIRALDLENYESHGIAEQRPLLNCTLLFYGQRLGLPDMMDMIGQSDNRDFLGLQFFGNFYLGLYYDSVGNAELAKLFMDFPTSSTRYSKQDMWYHLPRRLSTIRGWTDNP